MRCAQGALHTPRSLRRKKVGSLTVMDNVVFQVCSTENLPEFEEILELYDSVGWTMYTRDLAVLVAGIEGSQRVVIARRDGHLVGLARAVTDGATICYLQDLLVAPDAQRAGIGRRLVDEIFEPYKRVRHQVLITSEDLGQKVFYESLGFKEWGTEDLPGRAFIRFGRSG